ncbi:hypothetical protein AVEN_45994-1 [Araneus ventricosus]|uniref:Endonuclease/exonuclease/phosphatase domain-containing protein n=1 Tax=Araneus ventricosus TaxID=182803 RepID=A0A4Y2F5R9_ARAVE|nr:hypothetical protein AVEN_45994-1 [Araneus ventricosus]
MKSYDSCPAQDMRLVIGDFNAKIGKERFISSHAGHNSLHNDTNGNGQRLFEFVVSESMLIASTAYPHKEIHKYTLISPDGLTLKQTDQILVDRRHRNNVIDVRSYRGANVESDHLLVRTKVRFRLCKNFFRKRENKNYKPDISKLKEQNILNVYKLKLSNDIGSTMSTPNYDLNWRSVGEIILKAAIETIPRLGRRIRKV